jgi:hypothetical protein
MRGATARVSLVTATVMLLASKIYSVVNTLQYPVATGDAIGVDEGLTTTTPRISARAEVSDVTLARGRSKEVAVPGAKFGTTVCFTKVFLSSKNCSSTVRFGICVTVVLGGLEFRFTPTVAVQRTKQPLGLDHLPQGCHHCPCRFFFH